MRMRMEIVRCSYVCVAPDLWSGDILFRRMAPQRSKATDTASTPAIIPAYEDYSLCTLRFVPYLRGAFTQGGRIPWTRGPGLHNQWLAHYFFSSGSEKSRMGF